MIELGRMRIRGMRTNGTETMATEIRNKRATNIFSTIANAGLCRGRLSSAGFPSITPTPHLPTTPILHHPNLPGQQSKRKSTMNVSYPIIDADGHVLEKDRELHDYLGGRYSSAPRL